MLWFDFISLICRTFNWIWFLMFLLMRSAAEWCELGAIPFRTEAASGATWVRPTAHCTEECDMTKWVLIVRSRLRQLIYSLHSQFLMGSMPSYWLTRSKCGMTSNRLALRTESKRSPSDVNVQNTVNWKLLQLPPVGFNLEQLRRKFRNPHSFMAL